MNGLGKPVNYFELSDVEGIGPNGKSSGGIRANFVALDDKPDLLQIGLKAHVLRFDQPEVIGNTNGQATAQNLWSTEVSANYMHTLPSQNQWGLNLTTGSDSDVPFHSFQETTISLTGIYKKQIDAFHSWIFFLNYATNRAFAPGIPLPGAGYLSISPSNHTVVFAGVPFFFGWQATPDIGFKFSYFIPTIISTEWNYRIVNLTKAYLGFDWIPDSWWRADRTVETSQIIYDRKKALIGVKSPLFDRWYLNVYGGYFFDEKLFEAKSLTTSDVDKTSIPNQAAVGMDLSFQF